MISCKEYAEIAKKRIAEEVKKLPETPMLVVVQVGDNDSSNSYVKGKIKDCEEVGIEFGYLKFDYITEKELIDVINELNTDSEIHGIMLEMPLPDHINPKSIYNAISKEKDVDGFNINSSFKACTPLGAINYLNYIGYNFTGKDVCIIGRSNTIGKPLMEMLLDLDCTVTVCHSKTHPNSLATLIATSDLVFTCIDKIEYFCEHYFYPWQDIIDFGIGLGEDGKIHGNIKQSAVDSLKKERSNEEDTIFISGVGGTGLLTRIALLENVLKAYTNSNNITQNGSDSEID